MRKISFFLIVFIVVLSCKNNTGNEIKISQKQEKKEPESKSIIQPYLIVLGVAQDAGYPQITCQKTVAKGCIKTQKIKD